MELIHFFDKLKSVRAFVFDVDGVFTDNTVLLTEAGEMLRAMNLRDGLVVKMAVRAGFPVGIITGGRSQGVTKRLQMLGASDVFTGIADKSATLNEFLQKHEMTVADILYMGDDLPDLPVMKRVAVATAPADAVPEVLDVVDYVSPFKGGHGCVRDVLEKVLKLHGHWDEMVKAVAYGQG